MNISSSIRLNSIGTFLLFIFVLMTSSYAQSSNAGVNTEKLTTHPLGISAVKFVEMINQGLVDDAATYLADPYIQHNPRAADGVEAFRAAYKVISKAMPNRRYDIKRVFVEGDFVILHSHVTNGPGERGNAVVDIFRAVNGKFIEHWDVAQPVPEKAANENSMF